MVKAIVGAGGMGRWFAKRDRDLGIEVLISDKDIDIAKQVAQELGIGYGTTSEIIKRADEVMLAPSLDAMREVVEDNKSGLVGKVVYDIASVKNGTTRKLAEISIYAFSIHPMWGDATPSYAGQNLIMIPLHDLSSPEYKDLIEKYEAFFSSQGAQIKRVANEKEHDLLMAETLALYHFNAIVMGMTISGNNRSLEEHKSLIGTTALVADASIRSVVHSPPDLYFKIQEHNPFFRDVAKRYIQNASMLLAADRETFVQSMERANAFYQNGQDRDFYIQGVKALFADQVALINKR